MTLDHAEPETILSLVRTLVETTDPEDATDVMRTLHDIAGAVGVDVGAALGHDYD